MLSYCFCFNDYGTKIKDFVDSSNNIPFFIPEEWTLFGCTIVADVSTTSATIGGNFTAKYQLQPAESFQH